MGALPTGTVTFLFTDIVGSTERATALGDRRLRHLLESHGIAVHIAARVAALAGPGEVLVSSTMNELVAGSSIGFRDRGRSALKGVPGEWHLFEVEHGAFSPT